MDALHWFTDPITKHYADFDGRTSRQAFWMYILFYIVGYIILAALVDTLAMLYSLGLLVPSIAITARRLHDIGKSGWWQLIGLIPLIGLIIMIVWCAQETGKEANAYGPATVTPDANQTPAAAVAQNTLPTETNSASSDTTTQS